MLHSWVRKIKSKEDIEEAIKAYLNIMTIQEKIGQLRQLSVGDD
jgi:hypothetical protein